MVERRDKPRSQFAQFPRVVFRQCFENLFPDGRDLQKNATAVHGIVAA